MTASSRELRLAVGGRAGEVSALLLRPEGARVLLALAHGAGAGMRHPTLEALVERFARRGVATYRYQFPYFERGSRRPDPQPVLLATVRAALGAASELAGELPLLAGGRSMGGRMTTLALAEEAMPELRGIVLLAFPLHPAGKPATERAEHLARVGPPMLFLSGSRDALAELPLLRPVCAGLGAGARLHELAGADHGFGVRKRDGRSGDELLEEIADAVAAFAEEVAQGR